MPKHRRSLDKVAVRAPVSNDRNLSAFFHGTGGGRRINRKPLLEDDQTDGVSFDPPEVNLDNMEMDD